MKFFIFASIFLLGSLVIPTTQAFLGKYEKQYFINEEPKNENILLQTKWSFWKSETEKQDNQVQQEKQDKQEKQEKVNPEEKENNKVGVKEQAVVRKAAAQKQVVQAAPQAEVQHKSGKSKWVYSDPSIGSTEGKDFVVVPEKLDETVQQYNPKDNQEDKESAKTSKQSESNKYMKQSYIIKSTVKQANIKPLERMPGEKNEYYNRRSHKK